MKIGKSYSVGNIQKSRVWASIERKPFRWWRWILSFGPTYSGTVRGVVLGCPWFVVIAHTRGQRECSTQ